MSGPGIQKLRPSSKEKKFIDATIMALYHVTDGQFSDACEDSDFGNELLEWLTEQKKRITTRKK